MAGEQRYEKVAKSELLISLGPEFSQELYRSRSPGPHNLS